MKMGGVVKQSGLGSVTKIRAHSTLEYTTVH